MQISVFIHIEIRTITITKGPLIKAGSDRTLGRIGSDWQFALNSRQNRSRDIPRINVVESEVCTQFVTSLVFVFVFFYCKVISLFSEPT